jgi:hypothetical protein
MMGSSMDTCLQSARNITISGELCLQASNNPEAHSYAAMSMGGAIGRQ